MEITLLRHGDPEFEWLGCVKLRDIKKLAKAYDFAGIIGTPPEGAMLLIKDNGFIVCSDLRRSIESAKVLGATTIHSSDSMFREMSLPFFDSGSIKLPIKLWIAILRIFWFLGFSKNAESFFVSLKRAKIATQKLIEFAEQYDKVLLVGHGFLNHYIAKELLLNGWIGPSNPGRKYWEFSTYQYSKEE